MRNKFLLCKYADQKRCMDTECRGNESCPDFRPVIKEHVVIPVYPVTITHLRKGECH